MLTIAYPVIDPVLVEIGPVAIRWYALAYIAGILLGWRYMVRLVAVAPAIMAKTAVDDFLLWSTMGVILGGRLGYVLFYNPGYYLENPAEIIEVWSGGMSFHGGLLGVLAAVVWFARRRGVSVLRLGDAVCAVVPIGLFFGRIANFINAELYGRPSDVAWAMVFPTDPDQAPRHPSQLYQAFMEGLALLVALWAIRRFTGAWLRPGMMAGLFFVGYAVARTIGELFRQPDPQLGFIFADAVTMGQLLSLPMFVLGLGLIFHARGQPPLDPRTEKTIR